jgi:hypothetical protein
MDLLEKRRLVDSWSFPATSARSERFQTPQLHGLTTDRAHKDDRSIHQIKVENAVQHRFQ